MYNTNVANFPLNVSALHQNLFLYLSPGIALLWCNAVLLLPSSASSSPSHPWHQPCLNWHNRESFTSLPSWRKRSFFGASTSSSSPSPSIPQYYYPSSFSSPSVYWREQEEDEGGRDVGEEYDDALSSRLSWRGKRSAGPRQMPNIAERMWHLKLLVLELIVEVQNTMLRYVSNMYYIYDLHI